MADRHGCEQFVNDDDGYLRWLEANPFGFVVNSAQVPAANYLMWHKASCKWINTGSRNNWTTTGYIKTCSASVPPLEAWAARVASGTLKPCGSCRPGHAAGTRAALPTPSASGITRGASVVPRPASLLALDQAAQAGSRSVPNSISTGCPELDLSWDAYATMILGRSQILIPDTDEDLTWHAFLGHSIDMQGFRAAEFAGVDPLTRKAPGFVPLKARGIGVPELAALWEIPPIQQHLMTVTAGVPLQASLDVVNRFGGSTGTSLIEAFTHFPWRKFHWSVRALLQNSAVLKPFDFSFRRWLQEECQRLGAASFPPGDFRQVVVLNGARVPIERALRMQLERTFYMVGPAMSAYMICDWQLWLWREGRTAVFANFKLDSFHEEFARTFSRGAFPADEAGFARWWLGLFPELPPRLANECIWLAVENALVNLRPN